MRDAARALRVAGSRHREGGSPCSIAARIAAHVRLHQDGRLEPLQNKAAPGDYVIFRVLRDAMFIVAACCTGIPGNDQPAALELRVAEDLAEF